MSFKHDVLQPAVALVFAGLLIYGMLFIILTVSEWLSNGSLSVGLSF